MNIKWNKKSKKIVTTSSWHNLKIPQAVKKAYQILMVFHFKE